MHYSFQPSQYKAIAPDVRKIPEPSPGRKSAQRKATPALGVNAKKYNCPPLPSKPSKNAPRTSNQPAPAPCAIPQKEQDTPLTEIQQEQQPTEEQNGHCSENAHGGVLTVGQTPLHLITPITRLMHLPHQINSMTTLGYSGLVMHLQLNPTMPPKQNVSLLYNVGKSKPMT